LKKIKATQALFIKLGEGGQWDKECFEESILHFGYRETDHKDCMSKQWEKVRRSFRDATNPGAVTRHIKQIEYFYAQSETTLWITFSADRLWWCFAQAGVILQKDGTKIRRTLGKWSDADVNNVPLTKSRLSGKLLATQGFQGTICAVKELDYLLHKINGTFEPHVEKAQKSSENLSQALIPIIKNLHEKDLEILVDLIFRQGGWQRTGVAGGTEKDIDLDLINPITQERIAVQVKSKASLAVFKRYEEKYADMRGFAKFYFVTHSPNSDLQSFATKESSETFIFWGAEELANLATRTGLVGWLIDKAS
jgi:hypothetical protein